MEHIENEIYHFTLNTLIPAACKSLREFYTAYENGADIGIQTKEDESPASAADRQTETILRELIIARYPEHGIIGEEFPPLNPDAQYIWILDPLDGTREFLARQPGCFGNLIALLMDGRPVMGTIADPINNAIWIPQKLSLAKPGTIEIEDATISCTAPQGMFKDKQQLATLLAIGNECKELRTKLNCIGFAYLIDGKIDLAIEADLALHDIAALIPVLTSAGIIAIDLDGNDYAEKIFDLGEMTGNTINQKFDIIASPDKDFAFRILERMTQNSSLKRA